MSHSPAISPLDFVVDVGDDVECSSTMMEGMKEGGMAAREAHIQVQAEFEFSGRPRKSILLQTQ